MHRGAILAYPDDQGVPQCRLLLERGWGAYGRTAGWLMCNPSTADADHDDPTAGRVVHHSRRLECVRALVGNIWPLRTPYPADLWPRVRPMPREWRLANLEALAMIGAQSSVHLVAFGAEPFRRHRLDVLEAIDAFTLGGRHKLYCLGTTADNLPLHPLARGKFAVRNDCEIIEWSAKL